MSDFDLIVIGAGSGGVRAARFAAGFGAKVAILEDRHMGGTCVNVGCVPKKLFVYASEFATSFEDAAGFGWRVGEHEHDWPTLKQNKDTEIARLNGIYDRILAARDVEIIRGRGVLSSPTTVEVNGRTLSADKILIAVGGKPRLASFEGAEHVWSSDDAFALESLPSSVAVIGAGYIALEFAMIYQGLGLDVTVIARGPKILRGFDADVQSALSAELERRGIRVLTETTVSAVRGTSGDLSVELSDGSVLKTGGVLAAIGRVPATESLGLDKAGVALDERQYIRVGDRYETSSASVFAVGDVIGGMELTPVALAEGMCFARREFGDIERPVDYRFVATTVFTQPNVGTVGLTEEQARAAGHELSVFRSDFRAMKHTLGGRQERTLMKLIVDAKSDLVLGCHMVGPDAGEIIQGLSVAMTCGATKAHFDATIGIHPTAAEEFVTMRTPLSS